MDSGRPPSVPLSCIVLEQALSFPQRPEPLYTIYREYAGKPLGYACTSQPAMRRLCVCCRMSQPMHEADPRRLSLLPEGTPLPGGGPPCRHSNFLNGVLWSPDGSCLLTGSDDNW